MPATAGFVGAANRAGKPLASFRLVGLPRSLAQLSRLPSSAERFGAEKALALGPAIANYAKANAPFQDQSGDLRGSIGFEVQVRGGIIILIVYAATTYAIHVENHASLWVLIGAIEAYGPVIERYFSALPEISGPGEIRQGWGGGKGYASAADALAKLVPSTG